MTDTPVTDALVDHFQRVCAMLQSAFETFPDQAWCDEAEDCRAPSRIAYHILLSSERYTWQGLADEYIPKRRFSLNWETTPLAQLPTKAEFLQHFRTMAEEILNWLRSHGDTGLASSKPTFPWTGSCMLGQALYLLRHLQHHLGELNTELRRKGLPAGDWR